MVKKTVKSSKSDPKLPSWWPTGFVPCVARDPTSALGAPFNRVFMLAPTFEGVLCVQRWANISSLLGVRDRIIPNRQVRNYIMEEISLQSALEDLKVQMLAEGATHEAVRLVGEHIPITKEEYDIMAAKLTKKTTAAPKKDAKTTAPKAVKAERAAPTDKSYKHLMTPAKAVEGVRAGTWTARMLEIIMSTKSTAEARAALAKDKDYSDKSLDFGWAAKKGFISTPA